MLHYISFTVWLDKSSWTITCSDFLFIISCNTKLSSDFCLRVVFNLWTWPFLILPEATVPLSWATRMMIAFGAAKGLAFLHNAERPVIYRDFKTSNILLDSVSFWYFKVNLSSLSVAFYGCYKGITIFFTVIPNDSIGLYSKAFWFWTS